MDEKLMKNRTEQQAQQIQEKFDNRKKVTPLGFRAGIEINSLGDVIYQLFFTRATTATYYKFKRVPERLQKTGVLRSVEDSYLIATTYLPGITFKQVQLALDLFLVKNFKEKGLVRTFCHTVKRYVHNPTTTYSGVFTKEEINTKLDDNNLNYYATKKELQEVVAE